MRVRESYPSAQDVLDFSELSPIELTAVLSGTTEADVLNGYLSKVGTWRTESQFDKVLEGVQHITLRALEAAFWTDAYERLDGAPEWLRESFIVYWSDTFTALLKAGTFEDFAFFQDHLRNMLTYEKEPRLLP
jgi:hypothetical protein